MICEEFLDKFNKDVERLGSTYNINQLHAECYLVNMDSDRDECKKCNKYPACSNISIEEGK